MTNHHVREQIYPSTLLVSRLHHERSARIPNQWLYILLMLKNFVFYFLFLQSALNPYFYVLQHTDVSRIWYLQFQFHRVHKDVDD